MRALLDCSIIRNGGGIRLAADFIESTLEDTTLTWGYGISQEVSEGLPPELLEGVAERFCRILPGIEPM